MVVTSSFACFQACSALPKMLIGTVKVMSNIHKQYNSRESELLYALVGDFTLIVCERRPDKFLVAFVIDSNRRCRVFTISVQIRDARKRELTVCVARKSYN
ncbi:hypothetical protein POM88_028006 [Heracleum sosnowskyi]|uniref:Uncharacterized protein n=1 Tax=Heracleum sosnowskyi TaxID=360622 RepID=A0AAD8I8N6_9APIA|nr:hypothetical protein POM88_028006 [Heracleum sosnowskyi]